MKKRNDIQAEKVGWLIQVGQQYYTGDTRSQIESWTAFPQFAKIYKRRRWAYTMAERLEGKVIPISLFL